MEQLPALNCPNDSDLEEKSVTCFICKKIYTDARSLECGHSFCLCCLQEVQTSDESKPCAECDTMSVPAKKELKMLAPNVGLNENVAAVMKRKVKVREDLKRRGGPHYGITCDHCRKSNFLGARFKCGICDDFDICELCEAKPRTEVHDINHIFVKLRRGQTTTGPHKEVLIASVSDGIKKLSDNPESSERGDQTDRQTAGCSLKCSQCEASITSGSVFKCGACEDYDLCENCEEKSNTFHSEKHVFVKVPLQHPLSQDLPKEKLVQRDFYR